MRIVMRYPVLTASKGRTHIGDLHHDETLGVDFLACLVPRQPVAQRRCNVEVTRESSDEEVARLRGCLDDLVNITALPGLRTASEPAQTVSTLLDALLG